MMTTDPDLLAVRRKRRQERRCVSCGVPTPRAGLPIYRRDELEALPILGEDAERAAVARVFRPEHQE